MSKDANSDGDWGTHGRQQIINLSNPTADSVSRSRASAEAHHAAQAVGGKAKRTIMGCIFDMIFGPKK